MKGIWRFLFWLIVSLIALFLAILLGDRGSWYFAWVMGTVMIILISVAGTVLLDAQEEQAESQRR